MQNGLSSTVRGSRNARNNAKHCIHLHFRRLAGHLRTLATHCEQTIPCTRHQGLRYNRKSLNRIRRSQRYPCRMWNFVSIRILSGDMDAAVRHPGSERGFIIHEGHVRSLLVHAVFLLRDIRSLRFLLLNQQKSSSSHQAIPESTLFLQIFWSTKARPSRCSSNRSPLQPSLSSLSPLPVVRSAIVSVVSSRAWCVLSKNAKQ